MVWLRLTHADVTPGILGPEKGERAWGGLSRIGTAFEEDRAGVFRSVVHMAITQCEPPLGVGLAAPTTQTRWDYPPREAITRRAHASESIQPSP